MRILRAAQHDAVDEWMGHFGVAIGTIVALQDPLPCETLAQLLDVDMDEITEHCQTYTRFLRPVKRTRPSAYILRLYMWP